MLGLVPLSRFLVLILFVFGDETWDIKWLPLFDEQAELVDIYLGSVHVLDGEQDAIGGGQVLDDWNDLVSVGRIKVLSYLRLHFFRFRCPCSLSDLRGVNHWLGFDSSTKQVLHLFLPNYCVLFHDLPYDFLVHPIRV